MKILIVLFSIISFLFLFLFLAGIFFVFNKKISLKIKSAYSVFLAVCLVFYLFSAFSVFLGGILTNNLYNSGYIIFGLAPFIIGKLSGYKTLKFYTYLQLVVVFIGGIASFITLIA